MKPRLTTSTGDPVTPTAATARNVAMSFPENNMVVTERRVVKEEIEE
jgi:hypothetical protein